MPSLTNRITFRKHQFLWYSGLRSFIELAGPLGGPDPGKLDPGDLPGGGPPKGGPPNGVPSPLGRLGLSLPSGGPPACEFGFLCDPRPVLPFPDDPVLLLTCPPPLFLVVPLPLSPLDPL